MLPHGGDKHFFFFFIKLHIWYRRHKTVDYSSVRYMICKFSHSCKTLFLWKLLQILDISLL